MPGDKQHVVVSGDCLSKIAKEYGFTWKKLWDYGPNASLQQKRKDPNILMPGDIVHIPPAGKKQESKPLDQLHRFKRKQEQATFQIRLLVDGEPIKEQSCLLIFTSGLQGKVKAGETDKEGHLKIEGSKDIKLPGDARQLQLRVGTPPAQVMYELDLGRLAPHDVLLGVQQRLNNLGFHAGPEDGVDGPRTRGAVSWFQQMNKLKVDGIAGDDTQAKLKELYGS